MIAPVSLKDMRIQLIEGTSAFRFEHYMVTNIADTTLK